MTRKKKSKDLENKVELDDFASDLIKSLNKEQGSRVAYNLSADDSPTHVKRWISTGSRLLDYICSNRRNGGLPEGRIIEMFGPPSIGITKTSQLPDRSLAKAIFEPSGLISGITSSAASFVSCVVVRPATSLR